MTVQGLAEFAANLDLSIRHVGPAQPIPGSYWGAPEAGVVASTVFVQATTPLHSLLHEAAHVLIRTPEQRSGLDTDVGGDDGEEEAVCALQLELAAALAGYSLAACLADMDAWGYSFRQGSARGWFDEDAAAARTRWPAHVRELVAGLSGPDSAPATR